MKIVCYIGAFWVTFGLCMLSSSVAQDTQSLEDEKFDSILRDVLIENNSKSWDGFVSQARQDYLDRTNVIESLEFQKSLQGLNSAISTQDLELNALKRKIDELTEQIVIIQPQNNNPEDPLDNLQRSQPLNNRIKNLELVISALCNDAVSDTSKQVCVAWKGNAP